MYFFVRFWQVHDGPTTDSLRLHSGNGFSGRTLPKLTLTAESGEMTVRFVTDSLRTKNGFRAIFSAGKIDTIAFAKCRTFNY